MNAIRTNYREAIALTAGYADLSEVSPKTQFIAQSARWPSVQPM